MGKIKGKTPHKAARADFKSPPRPRRVTRSVTTPGSPEWKYASDNIFFKAATEDMFKQIESPEAPIKPTRRSSVYRRIGTTRRTATGESYSLALENTPKEFKKPLPQNKRHSVYKKSEDSAASPTLPRANRRASVHVGKVTKPQMKSPAGSRARRASVYQKSESKPKSPALTRSRRASMFVKPPVAPQKVHVPQKKTQIPEKSSPSAALKKSKLPTRQSSSSQLKSPTEKQTPSLKKGTATPERKTPPKKKTPSPKQKTVSPKLSSVPKSPQTPKISTTSFYKSPTKSSKFNVRKLASPVQKTSVPDKSPNFTVLKTSAKVGRADVPKVQLSPTISSKSPKKSPKSSEVRKQKASTSPAAQKATTKMPTPKATKTPTKDKRVTPKQAKKNRTPKASSPATKTPRLRKTPNKKVSLATPKSAKKSSDIALSSKESPVTPFKPVRKTSKTPLKSALTETGSKKLPSATPAKAAKILGVLVNKSSSKTPQTKRKSSSMEDSPTQKVKKSTVKTPKNKAATTPTRKATPGRKAPKSSKIEKTKSVLPKTSTPVRTGRKRPISDSPPISQIRSEKKRKDVLGEAIPVNVTLLEEKVEDMSLALPSTQSSWFGWCNIL